MVCKKSESFRVLEHVRDHNLKKIFLQINIKVTIISNSCYYIFLTAKIKKFFEVKKIYFGIYSSCIILKSEKYSKILGLPRIFWNVLEYF